MSWGYNLAPSWGLGSHSNVMSSPFDTQEYGSLEILTSALLSQASHHAHRVTTVSKFGENGIKCCCESDSCAFFQESTAFLLELEKDAETAASLGKALLERHEQYLFEGNRERNKLRNAVEELEGRNVTLEGENEDLEKENARTIEENRRLLVQLEEYNQGMSLDDIKVKEMQGDLDALHVRFHHPFSIPSPCLPNFGLLQRDLT